MIVGLQEEEEEQFNEQERNKLLMKWNRMCGKDGEQSLIGRNQKRRHRKVVLPNLFEDEMPDIQDESSVGHRSSSLVLGSKFIVTDVEVQGLSHPWLLFFFKIYVLTGLAF